MKRFVLILPLIALLFTLNACSRQQAVTQASVVNNTGGSAVNQAPASATPAAVLATAPATATATIPATVQATEPATAQAAIQATPALSLTPTQSVLHTQPATPTSEPSPTPTQAAPAPAVQKTSPPSAQTATALPAPTLPPTPTATAIAAKAAKPTPTSAPTPTATPAQAAGAAQAPANTSSKAGCVNKAAFYADVTVPDNTVFDQGQGFVKTWQIRNVGTCAWSKEYALVLVKGDLPAQANAYSMPLQVNSGDSVDISVQMTAPENGGQHYSDWQIRDNQGSVFGFGSGGSDYIWAQIVVNWPVKAGAAQAESQTVLPVTGACPAQANTNYLEQLLTLINDARAAQNRPPLQEQDQLMAAAQGHSLDMACNNFASHTGSDNSSWYDRITAQGYPYSYASENIYYGDPAYGADAAGAFDWWMHSKVHKDNILDPRVSQIGIGYAYDSKSDYGGYYTLDFASP